MTTLARPKFSDGQVHNIAGLTVYMLQQRLDLGDPNGGLSYGRRMGGRRSPSAA